MFYLHDQYQDDGFAVFENFLTDGEIDDMKSSCKEIIEKFDMNEHRSVFEAEKQVIVCDIGKSFTQVICIFSLFVHIVIFLLFSQQHGTNIS